jgi:hypothetical protein
MNREQVYAALYNIVSQATEFNLTSRRLIPADNISSAQMPALCQVQMGEKVYQKFKETAPVYTMDVDLWIYVLGTDNGDGIKAPVPSSILNPLIDSVETALAPNAATGVQNLGLTNVQHCYVSGRVEIFEGVHNNTTIAIVPVVILAT